jgi:hypothetical protein
VLAFGFLAFWGLRSLAGTASANPGAPTPVGHEWSQVENHGTSGDPINTYWLGTPGNQALELHVNGSRALRLEPATGQVLGYSPNVIAGYSSNTVLSTANDRVTGATIAGGGSQGGYNSVTDSWGTVGGGAGNTAGDFDFYDPYSAWFATVGGGDSNRAWGEYATVGGGGFNNAGGRPGASICGGWDNTASDAYAAVGGGANNNAGAQFATIGGGGSLTVGLGNRVTDDWGTVGGGMNNQAGDNAGYTSDRPYATVGGGNSNTASASYATVGGGNSNTASASYATVDGGNSSTASASNATVGGGGGNTASGDHATVGGGGANEATGPSASVCGGWDNTASGDKATVPGGGWSTAQGNYSFAAGRRAKANHTGSFVWADSNDKDFASTAANEFSVRSTGGARFVSGIDGAGVPNAGVTLAAGGNAWAAISDRSVKANFTAVDGRDVLERLESVPIETWNLKSQDESIRHIGPMAQDFYAAFGLGESETAITTVDADGVALAAIQGLYQLSQVQAGRIQALETENASLKQGLDSLEARVSALEGNGTNAAVSQASSSGLPAAWLVLGGGLALAVVGLVLAQRRLGGGRR